MTKKTIFLTEAEIDIANYIGEQRFRTNRAANVKDQKVGDQSHLFIDQNGAGGEIAFCRLVNVYPDLDTTPRSGSADCYIDGVGHIDVKTTELSNGHLIARITKKLGECDYFVLMTGTMEKGYTYKGWMYEAGLLRQENIIDLGRGPTYALTQDRLYTEFQYE